MVVAVEGVDMSPRGASRLRNDWWCLRMLYPEVRASSGGDETWVMTGCVSVGLA